MIFFRPAQARRAYSNGRSLSQTLLGAACLFTAAAAISLPALAASSTGTQSTSAASSGTALPDKGLSVSTELGFGIFQHTCLACHGKPEYKNAPSPATLRTYSPERIYKALTSGEMKAVGDTLTDTQRRIVAQAVAGRLLGTSPKGAAKFMANRCTSNERLSDPMAGPHWNGWGNNIGNTRFQPAAMAGLTAAQVPHLKLKWAFGLPNSTSAYSQPTVVSGRVFIGSDTGYVYSVKAETGCVYWSFAADGGVRGALTVEPFSGHGKTRYAVYFGDLKANVYALDARTGALIWKVHVDPQYTTRVTATPAYYKGTLFVPISSWEEFSAKSIDYPCCTSVGSIVALDAHTGKRLWKTYVIPERPKPVGKNSKGVQQYAPAGGSVWNTPAVDPKLHAIYFGTGDATTYPAANTSDSVMALDMTTGKMLWHYQVTSGDSFLVGCRGDAVTDNCPKTQGPDWDIPAPPILANLPGGKRLIVVGTKPGDVLALDPDHRGRLVWRMNVNGKLAGNSLPPGAKFPPGIMWGGAVYNHTVYYGLTRDGSIVAIRLADGKRQWKKKPEQADTSRATPATAIPGVVFVGGEDGKLFAVSTADGKALWSYDTDRAFDTVNGVPAHGGTIDSEGATVAGGMVFVGSGYSISRAQAGNVLLGFGVR